MALNDNPGRTNGWPEWASASSEQHALRVLVAEDDPTLLELCLRMVEALGHAGHGVPDGTSALATMAEADFDVVLTDLEMPGVDGIELADHVAQGRDEDGRPRLVLMTGSNPHMVDGARDRSVFDAIVYKPLTTDALRAILDRCGSGAGSARDEGAKLGPEPRPVLDVIVLDEVRELVSHDPAAFRRLVHGYLQESERSVRAIARCAHENNLEALQGTAHALASASAQMGAVRVTDLARRLEADAHQGGDHADELVQRLVKAHAQAVAALRGQLLHRV